MELAEGRETALEIEWRVTALVIACRKRTLKDFHATPDRRDHVTASR